MKCFKVKQVLKSGGAAREFYISDLVTHVIAKDTSFPQFNEAKEYNLTIVEVLYTRPRVGGDAFKCESEQLFRGIVVCPSQIPEDDRAVLWAMVTYHGGQCQLNLNPKCSHLVIPCPTGIVTPSWVVDSVKENKLQDEANYAPCRAEPKTQSETTSSLLTPDDNDRTTTTPLSASLPQETSPPSTPAGVSSKAPITLPSTLMSPISPVTTVMAEDKTSTAVTSLTVSENSFAKTSEHTWKERQKSLEDKENVVEVVTEAVKIGENNNEVLLSHKENRGGSDEKGKDKSPDSKGSSCLAGCVFTISDYQDCMDHDILDTWMEVIELHGGVVSPFYGKRCTHLLYGKKIVTAHWLNDVLLAKTMFAPSNPLHLPVPFEDKVSQCRRARYTGYLTRTSTHIICKSPSGEKFNKAREWGVHCVNAKWLGDIVTTGYPSPCNLVRYSTIGVADELEVTKDLLIRELITPWQTFGEGSGVAHQATNSGKRKPEEQLIIELGGTVVGSVMQCTHLIIRTVKFLCAISVAQYVVTPEWINKSHQSKRFLDASDYIVKDAQSEELYDMELRTSLQRARACPLLKGISVYVTQNVEPNPSSMKEIIQCAGGQI
ncbi:PAX-interacting protein 1 [Acropora cervicornis]|uniref:PAX-interacting protein 1 n=1 Tax=Acropora cervicornis TaxID=6130 RepID=A0AAD9VB87_ACRCE|nr:PAX-interacting protein 1 [Acropora cervicornis]